MTRARKKCAFADAVVAMLGDATFLEHRRQDWFSATFAGERHMLRLRLTGIEAMRKAEAFSKAIPEHEFTLPTRIVADIVVTNIVPDRQGADILIEALLLEQ